MRRDNDLFQYCKTWQPSRASADRAFQALLVLPSAQTGTQISWAMSLKHRESGHIRLGRIVLGCCTWGTPIGSVPLSEREVSSAKAINKFLDILTFLPVQTKVAVR